MSPKKIKKLADKKTRNETGLFIVEGDKNIRELLTSDFVVEEILGTTTFFDSVIELVNTYDERMQTRIELHEASESEIEATGTLMTNDAGIAVVRQKEASDLAIAQTSAKNDIVLVLNDVRDPGNLGTIIRIADWFGVAHIVASPTTVDFYNPKVIGASMGSFARTQVTYTELNDFLEQARESAIPIVVADMEGENTHMSRLPRNGILLMGSESHGVEEDLLAYATHRVTIPRFGKAESLNVSVATGILLDTLRRQ